MTANMWPVTVWMNGESAGRHTHHCHWLQQHNYRTAILGKAHFWLGSADDFYENRMAAMGESGPIELQAWSWPITLVWITPLRPWLAKNHPELMLSHQAVTDKGQQHGGQRDIRRRNWPTDIPTELYHTNWSPSAR